jgi:quercetin dioxygenase-like cupin family protein
MKALPIATKDVVGAKRWKDERGECVQVTQDDENLHIAVLEIKKGTERGNHYHEFAEEIFYIIYGKVRLYVIDEETNQEYWLYLSKGDKVNIPPNWTHIFMALEDTLLVEYSPTKYDRGDSHNDNLSN